MTQTVVVVETDPVPTLEIHTSTIQTIEVVTQGPRGQGVPLGGTTAQILRKIDDADCNTEWHTLAKADVNLGNVDDTSDIDKPISTLQGAAIDAKADLVDFEAHTGDTANPHGTTKAQVGLTNVDDTSDANKPVSTAQAAADTAVLNTAKTYAESLVIGLWDDRGSYNASGNTYPASGGSGTAGAILKGDIWTISVAGTLGGNQTDIGQTLRALIDAPGQTPANWASGGTIGLDDAITDNVTTRAPSQNAVFDALATKQAAIDALTLSEQGKVNSHGFPLSAAGAYLCTLTYNETTRTVTITPTGASFDVYVKGVKYTKTGAQSIVHSAAGTGLFIYYDETGTLVTSAVPWDLLKHAPVAFVFQDVTNSRRICFEERHHAESNAYWHRNQHFNEGTKASGTVSASGYTLLDGSTDAAVTFGIATLRIEDEDIQVDTQALPDNGPYTILERVGASGDWQITRANTLPFFQAANVLQYNQNNAGTWQRAALAEDTFVNYYVFGLPALPTTDVTPAPTTTQQIVIIPGQAVHASLALAHAETFAALAWGTVPFQELVPLFQVTLRYNAANPAAYTNTARCAIQTFLRTVGTAAAITQAAQTDHGTLSGLSDLDHPASAIINTPAGNIAATTVQGAIDELDTEKQAAAAKDASGGFPGLTLFKLNLKNAANTFTNFITNATTAARTWIMPDKDGTVAMLSDITGAGTLTQNPVVVATAGQTVFTVAGGYPVGLLRLFINGLKQPKEEFSAIDGSTYTMVTPCIGGEEHQTDVVSNQAMGVTSTITRTAPILATDNQATFTVVGGYVPGAIIPLVRGIPVNDYTASNGTSVTFTSGLPTGTEVEFLVFSALTLANAIPSTGGVSSGAISVPAGATGAQVPQAQEVVPNGPCFSAYASGGASVTSATDTRVPLNVEEFDTNACFDSVTNYRFQPNKAGYYQINGQVSLVGATLGRLLAVIRKNGAAFKYGADMPTGRSPVSALVFLNGTTDYVELWLYAVGTSLVFANSNADNYFGASLARSV